MAILLAAYLVLRAVFGPRLWPLSLVEPLLPWLALPSIGFVVVALAVRRWRSVVAHAVIAATWLALFGGTLRERPAPAAVGGTRLSVVTLNAASGLARIDDLEPFCRASGADVIALQELDDEEALALETRLLPEYPHRVLHGLGVPGKGVLSKFPIVASDLFRLQSERPYLRVVLDAHGERITVFDVHVPLEEVLLGPFGVAEDDAAELARRAFAAAPALLVGDFNATSNMRVYELVAAAGLVNAFERRGVGLGPTFPIFMRYRHMPWPRCVRIDHVWHTPDFTTLAAEIAPDAGSDHRPLVATLSLNLATH
ncbi:MAG: endonuclease/exonuclease/phosphatase family protein [Planctomycetes bacterium]|nr:endonuclease/exonuclease/phosphatase family protein [Planctomycetota bacterium]